MTTRIRHIFLTLFIFTCIPILTHAVDYTVDGNNFQASFQNYLTLAAGTPVEDTIILPAGSYTITSTLYYPVPIGGSPGILNIEGPSPTNQTVLSGNGTCTLLNLDYGYNGGFNDIGTTLTIRNISFQNGYYPGTGYQTYTGAVYVDVDYSNVLIEDCEFDSNESYEGGAGGLYVVAYYDGWVSMNGCTFTGNKAYGYYESAGGATIDTDGPVTVTDCEFGNNLLYQTDSSYDGAGGLYLSSDDGAVVISGNTFTGNVVQDNNDDCAGGAYIDASGSVTFENNTFSNNSAEESGGADIETSGPVTVSGNTFTDNAATYAYPGGLYVSGESAFLSSNTFSGNTAVSQGGGVEIYSLGSVTIVNNMFQNNSAIDPNDPVEYRNGIGGALCLSVFADRTITNNTFIGNSANYGGGIYARGVDSASHILNVYNNIFWDNESTGTRFPTAADLQVALNEFTTQPQPLTINLFNNDYADAYISDSEFLTLNEGDNINEDPQLDMTARLTSLSPCIEVGLNSAPGLAGILYDIDGDPRIADNDGDTVATIDMGADEYVGVLVRYDLTASVIGGNGTVSPTGGSYAPDTVVDLTAAPETGYQIASWSGTDDNASTALTNTVSMNSDKTVTVTFGLIPVTTYTITASAGAGGSIDPDGITTLNEGASQTYTITPDTGYHVVDVLVDSGSVGAITSYPFTNITANHTITASFAINTFTITASAETGGSISPSGDVPVNQGSSQDFSIEPNTGYHIVDVFVDSGSIGAVTSHLFENITADHTISATFAINTYTIDATSGPGGSISPEDQTVNYGDNLTFDILPGPSYDIADVQVDGISVGAVPSYEFVNITANHEISTTFAIKTFTITIIAGENGTADPAEDVVLDFGSNQDFTFTPNVNYHIDDVLLDGTSVGNQDTYQFTNVQADHTLEVVFAIDTYTITASSTIGGAIDPEGTTIVDYDGSQSFTITPDSGNHLVDVVVDGTSVGAVTSYPFENIAANHTITATFALDTFTITASAGAGGSISPTSDTATYGSDRTFTITPDTGYYVADVLVDGGSVGTVTSYLFENITADHTISATFAEIPPDQYALTIDTTGSGTVTLDPATGTYDDGTVVTLTAVAAAGWQFDGWGGDLSGSTSPTTITMDSNKSVNATFSLRTFTITASAEAGGSISPTSATVTYGGSQSFSITPDTHYHIADVQVDSTSVGAVSSYTIENVSADATISASFALDTFALTLTPPENGIIVVSPDLAEYTYGNVVQLSANPDTDYMFDGWNGDVTDPDAVETTVIMDADKTVTADFVLDNDSDGVPSEEEQGPDGTDTNYSGNDDTIPDAQQPNVVSGHTYNEEYITLASPTDTTIVDAELEALPESAPANYDFPYGLISFAISNVTDGSSTMEIYLPEGQTCDTYYKYDEASDTWEEFLYDEATGTGAVIEDNKITLHFVDGGHGDQDNIVDGIITDPGTPGISTSEDVPDSGDDDEWYACFISTAGNHTGMNLLFALFMLLLLAAIQPTLRSAEKR